MSELDKKRDDLANAWWARVNSGMGVSLHATSIYKHGFDAAASILQPKLDLAVEALEFYASRSDDHLYTKEQWESGFRFYHEAERALSKIKGGGE